MAVHEDITSFMQRWITAREEAAILSPTVLAVAARQNFERGPLELHIEYTSLEHLKQMARRVLANRYNDDGEDNPAYEQGELFSGHLQQRYPIPHQRGSDPQYKLRHLLTDRERAWNVEFLRKSATARLAHADALEAEGRGRASVS
jgi:hypothetical protein